VAMVIEAVAVVAVAAAAVAVAALFLPLLRVLTDPHVWVLVVGLHG
jgi:hypothetical protein